MKRYMPGFVPVNFKGAGSILIFAGAISIVLRFVAISNDWLFYVGASVIVVGLYLILIVPKD